MDPGGPRQYACYVWDQMDRLWSVLDRFDWNPIDRAVEIGVRVMEIVAVPVADLICLFIYVFEWIEVIAAVGFGLWWLASLLY